MKRDFNTVYLLRSIRFIPQNILNVQEKLILYTLLSCANADNDSWNGQQKLCELTGIKRTSIKKYMKSLEQKKFITVQRPVHYQRNETNHYALNVDNIMQYFVENKGSPDDPVPVYRGRHATISGSPRDHERGRQTTSKKQKEVTKEERAWTPPWEDVPPPPVHGEGAPDYVMKLLKGRRDWQDKNKTSH